MCVSISSNRRVTFYEIEFCSEHTLVTTKRPFEKPPTSYEQQAAQLQQRGMEISGLTHAEFYLQHLNYYRFSAYWLPFESDHTTHVFRSGTRFEEVLGLYVFDRELRLLMLDAIERVEVSIRSQWAYQCAHLHNPHGHLDATLSVNTGYPASLRAD